MQMKAKIVALVLALLLVGSFVSSPAQAATAADIEAAVEDGLAWLAGQQNLNGSWGTYDLVGHTGLAVLKFEEYAWEQGIDPFDPAYTYQAQVVNGLDYLFSRVVEMAIPVEPAGNPDTDGDGNGIAIYDVLHHRTYATGIAMMAIAASRHPASIVAVGPAAGRTYLDVLQNCVDWMAWAQVDVGYGPSRGGWRYSGDDTSADNSVSGYATLGLGFAGGFNFNCTIPTFVLTEMDFFINAVQDPVNGDTHDGGSWYVPQSSHWVNTLKTGNLLYEMALFGDGVGETRVQNAIDYLERHWNDPNQDPGWRGSGGSAAYQACFTIMKGLEAFDIQVLDVGGNPAFDWFDDMSTRIVDTQRADGRWAGGSWGDDILNTAWALLALERVVVPPASLCPDEYRFAAPAPGFTWDPYPTTFRSWMEVHFINDGGRDAFNVTATITCVPANVTVIDGDVSLGDIPAGGSAWSSDSFTLELDMTNPQDPNKGICWQVEYVDAAGVHRVIENVAKYCGERCSDICP
jgi:hypothetical protein